MLVAIWKEKITRFSNFIWITSLILNNCPLLTPSLKRHPPKSGAS